MSVINLDEVWFRRNPDRQLRLRRQTAEERSAWGSRLRPGVDPWCIVERETGAVTRFGLPAGETWDDADEELSELLEHVRSKAA